MHWNILDGVLSLLLGSSTITNFILFKKQQKRFKTAEAFEKEVLALKQVIEILKQQLEFSSTRITAGQDIVAAKDIYIQELASAKGILEIKHAINKKAMNEAYSCRCFLSKDISSCPVLAQRAINDDEILNKFLNKAKNI